MIRGASPATGTHAECYCNSCRAGEVYSGAPDPTPNPVGIFQTSPHRVEITQGREHLSAFSFGPKNLLRWQAACCGAALCNTPRNPKIAFVGLRTARLSEIDSIGPVVGQGFIPTANSKPRHKALGKLILSALKRIAANRISGRWKDTPFFDPKSGTPIGPVTVVSQQDRRALLP